MEIKTDNKWKQLRYCYEVPKKVMVKQFYHLGNDNLDGFILYLKRWYHTSDFMRIERHKDDDFSTWHGYASDSFFSGVVIRLSNDGEAYQIGTYFS